MASSKVTKEFRTYLIHVKRGSDQFASFLTLCRAGLSDLKVMEMAIERAAALKIKRPGGLHATIDDSILSEYVISLIEAAVSGDAAGFDRASFEDGAARLRLSGKEIARYLDEAKRHMPIKFWRDKPPRQFDYAKGRVRQKANYARRRDSIQSSAQSPLNGQAGQAAQRLWYHPVPSEELPEG